MYGIDIMHLTRGIALADVAHFLNQVRKMAFLPSGLHLLASYQAILSAFVTGYSGEHCLVDPLVLSWYRLLDDLRFLIRYPQMKSVAHRWYLERLQSAAIRQHVAMLHSCINSNRPGEKYLEEESYRQTFDRQLSAVRYDEIVYAKESSASLLWQVERRIIQALATDALRSKANSAYLDFACGTGRAISSLENLAAHAVGIDVSEPMLDRARGRCRQSTLICADITRTNGTIEGQYDLITAFRFLTNAEPALRSAALTARCVPALRMKVPC